MPGPQTSTHLFSRMKVKHYDFDPNATTPTDIAWVDMQNFRRFACSFFRTIGTGAVTFRILANAQSTGGGTDVVIKQHAVAAEPDAVGDQLFLECSAEELAQEAADAGIEGVRYVTANVSVATSTDEGVVTYMLAEPRFVSDGLTADIVA